MNNILIVGTGALATLFAARLTEVGHAITMLGTWQEGIDALNEYGARVIDPDGNETAFNVRATSKPSDCLGTKHAIVLVKAWQTERVAKQLAECLAEDGIALTLQNGLGNDEALSQALDGSATEITEHLRKNSVVKKKSRVALGTITAGATLLEAGLVKEAGAGIISLGREQALGPLEAAFLSANFEVKVVEDTKSLVWGKLVINAAINPLTALLRVANGELLERPSARALMEKLAQEAAEVAHAENIILPFSDPVAAVEEVVRKTAANRSSMLQDVLRGARTEIDAISGAVISIAQKHGMDTPANRVCWQLVKALQGDILPQS